MKDGNKSHSAERPDLLARSADLGERVAQRLRAAAARASFGHDDALGLEMESFRAELEAEAKKHRKPRKPRPDFHHLRVVK